MYDLAALRDLMPPTVEGDSVEWSRVSESWGREFPEDYRRFIEMYGAGTIDRYLVVLGPELKGEEPLTDGMLMETLDAQDAWSEARKSSELSGSSPELIAWAADASADILCWDASGSDPNAWPILVYNQDDYEWSRYECGMVEFLVRVLRAGFAECPLGDLSLWGSGSVRFLNKRERMRLSRQGLNPWTGKPNPYAQAHDD